MRYFFDTEFIEHTTGIQIISIGIYCEDGRSFYCESTSFDPRLADNWVKENVISKLQSHDRRFKAFDHHKLSKESGAPIRGLRTCICKEYEIGDCVLNWIGSDHEPEFYAYYASYDWVVFARLFGRLITNPEHFPMWVIDLKQMMWERGLDKEWKRATCPDPEGEHNALVDAMWNYNLYQKIIETKKFITQKIGDMAYSWIPMEI